MFPVFCFALFPLPADLAVHPPAAGLLRLAGGFEVSEDVSTGECRGAADGEENEKIDRFHIF